MFENNKNFYPTPQEIIDKMLAGIDFKWVRCILEPSAGDGRIVDTLIKEDHIDVDCIEKDPSLCYFLKGKGHRVVHDDFLTYSTMKEYDLIVMNPPFSDGCKHLLKALEMQKRNGGAIVCLLNAETLKNPYTNERKDLLHQLLGYKAQIEYMQGSFAAAERETSVEIALIKVQLPEIQRDSFILQKLRRAQEEKEFAEAEDTELIENDLFKSIVLQYQLEVEAGISLIKEYKAMSPFILSNFEKSKTGETIQTGKCILSLDLYSNGGSYSSQLSINGYIEDVREKYWRALFENEKFVGRLTCNLRSEYYNRVSELRKYDFSLYNIYQLKIDMQERLIKGVEDTIVALFDEISYNYSWWNETSNNIHYYNGWKTNKSWIINKKVIIPLMGYSDIKFSWGGFKPTQYDVISKLSDIEKCFNYLDGGLTDAVNMAYELERAENSEISKNIRLKYFTVTFYKKGTCHIVFNNDELLKKFNILGSQHKGWLPPSYGKVTYEDMSQEERAVIDDFEGKDAYAKVFANKEYYLFDQGSLNLLEDVS